MSPTTKALLVFILDEKIRTFLMLNDPQSLKQALCACALVDDIPRETHEALSEVARQLGALQRVAAKKGDFVLVLGIEKGKFVVRIHGDPYDKCDLNCGALARMLLSVGYNPINEDHILMRSSSIDFPQEGGAPRRFNANKVVREAILLAYGAKMVSQVTMKT